ncbi:MAG: glycosyltransferase family 87 protein [Nitrospiraceae bacterium]|nr:glycosyltransferase family 87 protein [Nitrospiraceae bacterium]
MTILDFPFHFNFAQKFWRGHTTADSGQSIYSPENHLRVTSDWAGARVSHSLHFGYSPTMLWVLAPLAPFSHATAYILFSAAGLLAIFWITRPSRCRGGIGLFTFFGQLAQRCFAIGQTALLTGAGLLYLAERSRDDCPAETWGKAFLSGVVLWALTAKPPIALTAGTVLLGLRRWRILAAGAALTLLSTLIAAPLMGAHWISDYIHLLGAYNRASAGTIFAWSIRPEMMVNLRAVLNIDAGLADDAAGVISAAVWLIALLFTALCGLRGLFGADKLWAISMLSYLLFCPHVTSTEELLLAVVFSILIPVRGKLSGRALVLFFLLPLLPVLSALAGPLYPVRLPVFIVQLCLMALIAADFRKPAEMPAAELPIVAS